jgi:proline racemase
MEAISLPQPRRGTLAWRDADGGPADEHKRPQVLREQRSSARVRESVRSAGVWQGEKRECQRVSQKKLHSQEREARDRVRLSKFPLNCHAPDRHPDGTGLKARCAFAHRAGCPEGSSRKGFSR